MIRSFFRHSFLYSLVGFLNQGIGLLLTPLYTRVFDPEDYGVLDWTLIVGTLTIGLLSLQLGQGLAFYFSDTKDESERKQIASTTFLFVVGSSAIPLVLTLLAPEFFSTLVIGDADHTLLVKLLGLYILINGMATQFDNLLKWMMNARGRFLSSSIQSFLTIGVIAYFVLVLDLGVEGVLMGRIIGQVAVIVIVWFMTKQYLSLSFSRPYFNKILAYSFPLIFVSLGSLLMGYVDRIIIKSMINYDAMGLYAVGYKFASVLNLLFVGIGGALSPLILNHYKEKETPGQIRNIFNMVFVLGLLMITSMSIFSHEILYIFTTPKYYAGYIFIPFVASMFFFDQLFQFAPGLSIKKKTKTLSAIFVVKLALNLGLNYVAVIHYGAQGVAVATLITSLLGLLGVMYFSQKEYYIPYQLRQYLPAVIICGVLIYVAINLELSSYWLSLAAKAGVVLLAMAGLFVIGIFRPKEQLGSFVNSIRGK